MKVEEGERYGIIPAPTGPANPPSCTLAGLRAAATASRFGGEAIGSHRAPHRRPRPGDGVPEDAPVSSLSVEESLLVGIIRNAPDRGTSSASAVSRSSASGAATGTAVGGSQQQMVAIGRA